VGKYFDDSVKLLTTIVRQGIDQGEFRDVDARQSAVTIAAQYEGLMLMWVVNPAAFDLEQSCHHAIILTLGSLASSPAA
jgi:transcriptional regulator BetI-like protein